MITGTGVLCGFRTRQDPQEPPYIFELLHDPQGDGIGRTIAGGRYGDQELALWLEEQEYVDERQVKSACSLASEAARELPAAERLARLLYEYAQSTCPALLE